MVEDFKDSECCAIWEGEDTEEAQPHDIFSYEIIIYEYRQRLLGALLTYAHMKPPMHFLSDILFTYSMTILKHWIAAKLKCKL